MPRAARAFLMTVATALAANVPPSEGRGAPVADHPSPVAAAAAAAERGWFGLARELWQQSGGGADEPAGFLSRLETFEREIDLAALRRGREQASRWAGGRSRTLWRRALVGGRVQSPPTSTGGLAVWSTGAAIHAVRLEDGMPPWPAGTASLDTRLFPRGAAAAPSGGLAAAAPPSPVCVAGSRAYAALDTGASEALCCLDLSPAAEGRLVWLVDVARIVAIGGGLPDGPLCCDGPPVADHELCCVVLRSAGARDELVLAAFAAADGRLAWARRCGTALAADGGDHARGRRSPVFVEDRIVLATHAGTVIAFERDGRPAWRTRMPGPPARAVEREAPAAARQLPPPAAMPDTRVAGGLVIVAPRDAGLHAGSVVAIEARRGAVAWRWAGDEAVVGLWGPVGDGVVAVTLGAEDATGLVRLDRVTGRQAGPPVTLSGRSAGPVMLVDDTLFHPRFRAEAGHGDGIVLDAFDPESLAARPLSIEVDLRESTGGKDPHCFVTGGSGALAVMVPAAITCVEGEAGVVDGGGESR